jgi:hypothetical protein
MWKFSAVILILLSAWNSVLGGVGTLVLCFHNNGKTHVDLAGEAVHPNAGECAGEQESSGVSNCTSCTDILLEAFDLEPARPDELTSVHVPDPVVSGTDFLLERAIFPLKFHAEYGQPVRDPPEGEPIPLLVSRTIVFRL